MRAPALLIMPVAALMLPGCVAKTVVDVVTLPVKVASKGVDLATTSQSEADQKRGRALREREEQIGKLDRLRAKLKDKCEDGDDDACDQLRTVEDQIQQLKDAQL